MRHAIAVMGMVLLAAPLHAQSNGRDAGTTIDSARTAAGRVRYIGKTARTEGKPRSFQVVRVAVPPEVTDVERVTFHVRPLNEFSIIGRQTGTVRIRDNLDVLVTIAVPATAAAGTRGAARVVFQSPDTEVDVPIEMTVTPVYGLALHAPTELRGLRAGDRFEVPVRIQNRGNAPDTVRLQLELPVGWRLLTRDTSRMIIPPFGVRERTLRIETPENSGSGSFFIRMYAFSSFATAQSLLTLTLGTPLNQNRPVGPAVRATVGTVAVEGDGAQTVSQLAISGPLTNDIHIDGRLTTTPDLSGPLVSGLARVGTFISAPHLTAWTSDWRMTAGSTVLAMTDLTGLNAGGRGLAWDFNDTTRTMGLVAARSDHNAAAASDHGELFGARYEQNLRHMRIGAAATHLSGVGLRHQQLSAFGVRARSYRMNTLTFGGETAYRDFGTGSGFGWSANVLHEGSDERGELRITRAPGGTEAFARAEREVQASFAKSFVNGFDFLGSYVRTEDNTVASRAFRSSSLSLTPSYLVTNTLRLRGELRRLSFDVDATPIAYGSAETHVGAGASGLWRGYNFSSDVGVARISRSVTAADIAADDQGMRFVWRASASRPTAVGVLQLESSYERNDPTTGYLPEQFLLTARSERIQISSLSSRLQLDGELTLQTWSGVQPMLTVRAGADYTINNETEIAFSLERNPLLSGLRERTPWIAAIKVERSIGVPRVSLGRAAGIVYRDFNGNGKRDAGEPGEPNVAVRRGSARAVTGFDGSFRFWEASTGDILLDPATLPFGWLVGNRDDGNIALIPTTRVEVTLEPGAAERLRNIDLSLVTVIARDMAGREWTGRRVSSNVAIFEALPIGTYKLDADFSAMVEPLRVNEPVVVEVVEGSVGRVSLPVAGRPLRFRQNNP